MLLQQAQTFMRNSLMAISSKMKCDMYNIFILLQNAPKPEKSPKDLYDLCGFCPYKTEEIVPGKLWEIVYIHENNGRTDVDAKKQMKDFFGMDPK